MVARDRQILDAALRLFFERGFDAVGVDEIGEAAGASGPAIYRHFRSKEEVLSTLFDEAMDRLLELCGPRLEDPRAELHALIRGQVTFALGDRALLSVYSREDRSLSAPARRRLHRRQRQHVERWVDALGGCYPGRRADQLRATAHAMIGMLLSVAHWPRQARGTERLSAVLEDLVLGALGGYDAAGVDGGPTAGATGAVA